MQYSNAVQRGKIPPDQPSVKKCRVKGERQMTLFVMTYRFSIFAPDPNLGLCRWLTHMAKHDWVLLATQPPELDPGISQRFPFSPSGDVTSSGRSRRLGDASALTQALDHVMVVNRGLRQNAKLLINLSVCIPTPYLWL